MDLPNFCVENRRKGHSLSFLRSALQPTYKMPKSFEFGVPLSGRVMEENCFKNIHTNSCNAQYTFQEVNKSEQCHSKKSCFDHFQKLSHFSFSRVVGGFVGSKSQGGSAFREPHQVWDVIFRQFMDSTCQATMNNNAQQYISISEAVSQSIFGQLSNSTNSLDFSSLIINKHCDFFSSNKPSEKMQVLNDSLCHKNSENPKVNKKVALNKDPSNTQLVSVRVQKNDEINMEAHLPSLKQSYADVAKAFAATKSEASNKSDKYQCVPTSLSHKRTLVNNQNSRKGSEKYRKRRQNVICYTQPSNNNSSQNQHRKLTILPDKCEDQIPSKFSKNKFENLRHSKTENSNTCKVRSKDGSASAIPAKNSKDQEDRKRRYNKYRNNNMREKERKIVHQQVHEDVVFACNMPQQECQNWRCGHNRLSYVQNGLDLNARRGHNRTKNYKQQSRLHSPPPRTFVSDSAEINKPRAEEPPSLKDEDISKIGEMSQDTLCNVEKSEFGSSVNSVGSGDNSESSFSSSPSSSTVVLPLRLRVSSECSIDSEDSSVVFEREDSDLDLEIENDSDSDFGSVKDYSSECDSEEDCDEVDFCYETPSEDTNVVTGSPFADVYSSLPDRLKDINEKWHKENNVFPIKEKIPKKVHFAGPEKLAKVHHMIHWPFAYRAARRGPWEEIGRDRCRFKMRIERAERDLSQILDPQHRRRIWEERMCDLGSI